MSLINGLDHVNIRTADLAGTKALFVDVLGLREGWRQQPHPQFAAQPLGGGRTLYTAGEKTQQFSPLLLAPP